MFICQFSYTVILQNGDFFSFQVVIDTIYITIRSIIFTSLVVWKPENAVIAFSVAQVFSALVASLCYYLYFYYYISKRNKEQGLLKKDQPTSPNSPVYDDFPFRSLLDFLPRKLNDRVSDFFFFFFMFTLHSVFLNNLLNYTQSSRKPWVVREIPVSL